jgi:geranylgeranyl reductase
MDLRTKVLVVGGGPAGATAARFLARNDIDVILLERNLSFVKPCGGCITLTAFEEFGIPKTIIKKEVKHIKLVSPKDKELLIELKNGTLAIVTRGEFDTTLRNLAKEKGLYVLEGECVQLASDKKMYRTESNIRKKKVEILSEYIVAADGVNSRLKILLGIKPCQAIFTVNERRNEPLSKFCEFWFGSGHAPGFYSWVFPTDNGSSLGTGTIHQGSINMLLERFKKRRGIIGDGQKIVYRIPLWKGNIYNKGRILFAGDSAGHVLPFTFEGIYYAMKAGELAAEAIIEKKIEKYKQMWKNQFQKRFILMDKLKNYFLKDDSAAEKLIALHRKQEIQDVSMRLWLKKDNSYLSLKEYINFFRKFLS